MYHDLIVEISNIVNFSWLEGCSEVLCQPVTHDEVHTMLFSMGSGKALGPDRYSVAFFKYAWSMLG